MLFLRLIITSFTTTAASLLLIALPGAAAAVAQQTISYPPPSRAEMEYEVARDPDPTAEAATTTTAAGNQQQGLLRARLLQEDYDNNGQPYCPSPAEPCSTFESGGKVFDMYDLFLVDSKGKCRDVCAGGSKITDRQAVGYECGKCEVPRCKGQKVCKEFDNGLPGYDVHRMDPDTGGCEGMCAGGSTLADYLLDEDWVCGVCPLPTCPDQDEEDGEDPCYVHPGAPDVRYYRVKREAGGKCSDVCVSNTGHLLRERLFSGFWECGTCRRNQNREDDEERVPGEEEGVRTISSSAAAATFTATTVATTKVDPLPEGGADDCPTEEMQCPDGSTVTNIGSPNCELRPCPHNDEEERRPMPENLPRCPDQDEPCHMFSGKWPGYAVFKVGDDGVSCTHKCAAGGSLTSLQEEDGYSCGACPPVAPLCPDQNPCKRYGDQLAYSIYRERVDGRTKRCREMCGTADKLREKLERGWKCGTCPEY